MVSVQSVLDYHIFSRYAAAFAGMRRAPAESRFLVLAAEGMATIAVQGTPTVPKAPVPSRRRLPSLFRSTISRLGSISHELDLLEPSTGLRSSEEAFVLLHGQHCALITRLLQAVPQTCMHAWSCCC